MPVCEPVHAGDGVAAGTDERDVRRHEGCLDQEQDEKGREDAAEEGDGHVTRSRAAAFAICNASIRTSYISISGCLLVRKGVRFACCLKQEVVERELERVRGPDEHLWPGAMLCLLELDQVLACDAAHELAELVVGVALRAASSPKTSGDEGQRSEPDSVAELLEVGLCCRAHGA